MIHILNTYWSFSYTIYDSMWSTYMIDRVESKIFFWFICYKKSDERRLGKLICHVFRWNRGICILLLHLCSYLKHLEGFRDDSGYQLLVMENMLLLNLLVISQDSLGVEIHWRRGSGYVVLFQSIFLSDFWPYIWPWWGL